MHRHWLTQMHHTHWVNWASTALAAVATTVTYRWEDQNFQWRRRWRRQELKKGGGKKGKKHEKRHPPYDYAAWPARVCRSDQRVFPSPPCPATLPSDWSSPHSHPAHARTHTHTHTNVQSMSWCTPQHINGLSPKYKQLAQVLVPTIIHIHLHPKRSHGTHLYTLVRLHPRTHT